MVAAAGTGDPSLWEVGALGPARQLWVSKLMQSQCCGNVKLRYGTLRSFSRKQCFIVPAQTQWTRVQRLSPENKGISPYIPLQAGYRSKKQSSTHLWLHVTPLAISFSQCYVTFMFQFFKFYLPALPSLPLSHQNTTYFFSGPLPCYITSPFDARIRLRSKSIILI
jgi:hypothetical protein